MRIDFANKKIIITPSEDKMLDDGGYIKATFKGKADELIGKVTLDLLATYSVLSADWMRVMHEGDERDGRDAFYINFAERTIDKYNNVTEVIWISKPYNDTYVVNALEDNFQPTNMQNCEVIVE